MKRERTIKIDDVDGRGGRERCNWDNNELRDQDREQRRLLREQQEILKQEQPKK